MSAGQAKGYAKREHYSIELEDLCSLTEQASNLFVEIGFGDGRVLASFAHERSDWTCIGIDVYRPGIGALIQECENKTLDNVHILEIDATSALEHLPDCSINLLYILFPDPWPKRRHRFRRLINEEFMGVLKDKLANDGEIYISTDWKDYANQIETVMTRFFVGTSLESADHRSKTRYEVKAEQAGHRIWNYLFRRCS